MGTQKLLRHVAIKDADKGIVDLVFATFNEKDSDGDVTLPGAFDDGARVPVSAYGHTSWEGRLPVGIATIKSTDREAQATAQFFMEVPEARATFTTVKRLHDEGLGEWSYGYDAQEFSFGEYAGEHVRFLKKQKVLEISPVLVGAGNTRTVGAKGRKGDQGATPAERGHLGALKVHETDTSVKAWRYDEVVRDLALIATVNDLRAIHAYVDPDGDPEHKAAYSFLHHEGVGGAANVRACLMAIAALNGAKGAQVPGGARAAVYEHLASHLRDAERIPPDLRSPGGTLKFQDEAMVVLADLGHLVAFAGEVGASRALKGKSLTKANREVLSWISEELDKLKALIDENPDDMTHEFLRAIRRNVTGA